MFSLKFRAATLIASLKKPTNGFTPNLRNLPNSKFLYLFIAGLVLMIIPVDVLAQIDVGGYGETIEKLKDFTNDTVFPALKIIAIVLTGYLIIKSVLQVASGDPKWMSTLLYAFLAAIIFYGAPTLIESIINGWDVDYEIE